MIRIRKHRVSDSLEKLPCFNVGHFPLGDSAAACTIDRLYSLPCFGRRAGLFHQLSHCHTSEGFIWGELPQRFNCSVEPLLNISIYHNILCGGKNTFINYILFPKGGFSKKSPKKSSAQKPPKDRGFPYKWAYSGVMWLETGYCRRDCLACSPLCTSVRRLRCAAQSSLPNEQNPLHGVQGSLYVAQRAMFAMITAFNSVH